MIFHLCFVYAATVLYAESFAVEEDLGRVDRAVFDAVGGKDGIGYLCGKLAWLIFIHV